MDGKLHDYMRVGIVHFMMYPSCMGGEGPIEESVRRIAEDDFFQVIEVTQMKDPQVRAKVRQIAADNQVELIFGAQPILLGGKLNLNHPDPKERQRAVDGVKAGINQATELGSKSIGVLSGQVSEDRAEASARLVDSLKQLCAYGKSKGVSVSLETFDQVPYGKNCLIGPTPDAVKVSEAVRSEFPDFGLMLDLSHLPLIGETSEFALKTAGTHMVHAHMGNCAMDDPQHPAYGDNHPRFGCPGGRNDVPELAEYLRVLLDTGYLAKGKGAIVSFEVKPMPGEDAEELIAASKECLEKAWEQV